MAALPAAPPTGVPASILVHATPARLAKYGTSALRDGHGRPHLEQLGLLSAGFLRQYQVGFIPSNYRDALTDEDNRFLGAVDLANGVVLPLTLSTSGTVVALLCLLPNHADPIMVGAAANATFAARWPSPLPAEVILCGLPTTAARRLGSQPPVLLVHAMATDIGAQVQALPSPGRSPRPGDPDPVFVSAC